MQKLQIRVLFITLCALSGILFLTKSNAHAADPIAKAFAQKEISYPDYVYYELVSVFDESKLPARYKTAGKQEPTRDATLFLTYARLHFNHFRPDQQQFLSAIFARPTDAGDQYVFSTTEATPYCTTNFCIHYVTSTTDAPPGTDANANSVPDYVETMATEFENVFTTENSGFGYNAPPADGAKGGNSKFDVYIKDIDGGTTKLYGFASPEDDSGLASACLTTSTGCTSWMGMDNDYANICAGQASSCQTNSIKVTAAHEYFHAVQFGYFVNQPGWLAESTASWMEDEVYDTINDNYQYKDMFVTPEQSLDLVQGDGASDNGYRDWFFQRFISEKYGRNNIKKIFESGAASCGSSANDVALRLCVYNLYDTILQQNTGAPTLKGVFADFAQRNYTKVGADGIYKEGASYQDIAIATTHTTYPVTTQTSTLNHLAAKYYQFTAADTNNNVLTITFNGPDGKDFAAKIIKVTSGGTKTEDAITLDSSTNDGTYTFAGFGSTYSKVILVAANTGKIASDATMTGAKVNTNGSTDALSYSYSASSAVFSNPSAPTGVSATAGSAQVALSWTAATAGSFSIASYNVYRSATSGGTQTKINTSAVTSTSYTDTGLTNGTTYFYVIKAVDSQGNESSASTEVNATPAAAVTTNPSAPTNVSATAGDTQAALSWTASTAGTNAISGYNAYRSTTSGGTYTKINSSAVTSTSYTDTGLTNGTKYYYVVKAVDSQGNESSASSEVNATPFAKPGAPTGVTATAGDAQVALSWTAPAKTTYTVSSYNVYRSTTTGTGYAKINSSAVTATTYTDSTVSNGTKYFYVVTAVDSQSNESANSSEVNGTPAAAAVNPPSTPDNVTAAAGDTQVSLSWSASTQGTYTVSGYNVYRSTTTGTGYTKINSSTLTARSYTDTGLTNGTKYFYVVRAVDSQGSESASSSEVYATPSATVTTPSAPTNVSASAGEAKATISWKSISNATSYNIYMAAQSGVTKSNYASLTGGAKITGATSPYAASGLTNGTTYYFVVTAVNSAGESSESSEASAAPQSSAPVVTTVEAENDPEVDEALDNPDVQSALSIPAGQIMSQTVTAIDPAKPSGTVTTVVNFAESISSVTIEIYALNGKRVSSATLPGTGTAGVYEFEMDAKDDNGNLLSNGIYICRTIARGVSGSVTEKVSKIVIFR